MSTVTAITEIRTALKAARQAWSTYTLEVEYDGLSTVDLSTQVNPYVACEIIFLDGHQLDMNAQPLAVQYGQIHISACVKIGQNEATLKAARLIDHFTPYLELKDWALVRTHAAAAHASYDEKGWKHWPLLVPFWYQRIAS
jgi:hypothetical protein